MLPPIRSLNKDRLCGYPSQRFVTPPSSDFLCSICGFVVREPLECKKCYRLICTLCLFCKDQPSPELTMDLHCPSCGPEFKPHKPSKVLTRIVNELMIYCKFQANGCIEKTPVRKITSHEACCKFKMVECENSGFCKAKGIAYSFIETQVTPMKSGRFVCSKKCKKLMKFQNFLSGNSYNNALRKYYNCIKKTAELEQEEIPS